MKRVNEEGGYALLMVMMLMMLFTVIGLGLLATNINASKQSSTKEGHVQARHYAEMGVLHYQAAIKKELKDNQNEIHNKDGFCSTIEGLPTTFEESNYQISSSNCTYENEEITISFNSEGYAGINKVEEIEATISIEKQTGPPIKPTAPEDANINWPTCPENNSHGQECNDIVPKFTVVENISMKRGDLKFEDHLIVNSLTVEGGNEALLTVKKDLYIQNSLKALNHACIVVQGNLTILNSIEAGNKIYIFVYGDANFPLSIKMAKPNADIFVLGDVYIENVKEENPVAYKPFPNGDSYNGCSLPPKNPPPGKWNLNSEIHAHYH